MGSVRKLVRALLTILLLVTTVFIILRLSDDPAIYVLGVEADADALAAYRTAWGLDRPILEQYLIFLGEILHGEFGRSHIEARDAFDTVMARVPRTLLLMGITIVMALAIGIPAGVLAALRHGSWTDRAIMSVTVAGFCLPNFVIGIVLILLCSVVWGILPPAGHETPAHLVMPALTMATAEAAVFARYTRTAMLQVLNQPYMRTALAKGLDWPRAVRRHGLPNTLIPVVTIGGFFVGSMMAGAVVTESVFAWPGVGRLLVTSVANRDLPVVQVIVILIGSSMVVTNLLVDLAYGWLDPRIRDVAGNRGAGS